MKEYTDNEIIECLRNRESYVVRYLFDRYLPMIRLMVCQMGGNSEDAKDIFQEGLMIMLEKIDNNQFVLTCKFKTFLYCVCLNLWKSVIVKRHAAENYFNRRIEEDSGYDFSEDSDENLRQEIFKTAYDSLDEVSKTILKLYWEEMSPQKIAEKLGYSYGYVRKKKCEAQAELIKKVKRHPYFRIMTESVGILQNKKKPITISNS
ncbi:MAG: sigma-70 family RNA polymerase sigma factor [Bacteroidales bacterium]|nr:sigma-70 family RNA polymerase sigma factor [Bacteroidales bacterium]